MSKLKKTISILAAAVFLLSMALPVFAEGSSEPEYGPLVLTPDNWTSDRTAAAESPTVPEARWAAGSYAVLSIPETTAMLTVSPAEAKAGQEITVSCTAVGEGFTDPAYAWEVNGTADESTAAQLIHTGKSRIVHR